MKRIWIILLSIIIVSLIILFFYPAKPTKRIITKTITHLKINSIPVITIKEGMKFPDIELDKLIPSEFTSSNEFIWTCSGNKNLLVNISDGTLKIKSANPDCSGIDTLTLRLWKNNVLIDSGILVVNILSVNDAPTLNSIPVLTVNEGDSFPSIYLDKIVTDVDNSFPELSWHTSESNHFRAHIKANLLSFTNTDNNWFGRDTLKLTVVDPNNLKSSANIILNVLPVNDPPEISEFPVQVISEGEQFPPINLSKFVSDPDDRFEDLQFDFSGNKYVKISFQGKYLTAVAADSNWFGNDTLKITTKDKGNLECAKEIVFISTPVNDPPVLAKIPDDFIDENHNFRNIDLNRFASDVDDSTLQWTTTHNGNLQIDIDDKNIMRVSRINKDWTGTDTIIIRVADKETYTESASLITINGTRWFRQYPIGQLQNLALIGVNDVVSLSSEFINWDQEKLLTAAGITAVTAILITSDNRVHNNIVSHKNKSLNTISDIGEIYGETYTTEIAAASLGLYGLIADDNKSLQLGLEVYESYFIANNISKFLKKAFGRPRPNTGLSSDQFKFFPAGKANNYAFPSGHATLAFSLSTVLASVTDDYYLKALFYLPAVTTAFSRIYTDHHWASDVFLGGSIGFLVGNYLVNRHRSPQSNNIIFGFDGDGDFSVKYYF